MRDFGTTYDIFHTFAEKKQTYIQTKIYSKVMNTEVLRIIEGGLANDKRKILTYSAKLADRLQKENEIPLAKCIRQIIDSSIPQSQAIADAMRVIPLDSDSRLQIVEVIPADEEKQSIILSPVVEKQVSEFIDIIKHSSALELAGVEIKKTLLLYGQPGCGKTSIAHYISEKTGLPLIVARLDGIVSSLLGSTAKNIRKIFDYAQSVPCILFLDEFDAIAKARDDQHELGELKRVINTLLQNIDSMPSSCVLLAATNHQEMLDPAVWRRFVQTIEVGLPSQEAIMEMNDVFTAPFTSDMTEEQKRSLAKTLDGLSPSDIKNIFDRAKVKSVIDGEQTISFHKLLSGAYETICKEQTEEDYVRFLSNHGLTQATINKLTGISLRKIKTYLSSK